MTSTFQFFRAKVYRTLNYVKYHVLSFDVLLFSYFCFLCIFSLLFSVFTHSFLCYCTPSVSYIVLTATFLHIINKWVKTFYSIWTYVHVQFIITKIWNCCKNLPSIITAKHETICKNIQNTRTQHKRYKWYVKPYVSKNKKKYILEHNWSTNQFRLLVNLIPSRCTVQTITVRFSE